MVIISPVFEANGFIPKKFTCDGGNMNPELEIQNLPDGVKSLALIVHDPDAPHPGGFTHWVMWNIDPMATTIKEESVPPGAVEGENGSGEIGFIAPCPPSGVHHYHFMLYALDTKLNLPLSSGKEELLGAMEGRIIEKAELVGLYQRQQ